MARRDLPKLVNVARAVKHPFMLPKLVHPNLVFSMLYNHFALGKEQLKKLKAPNYHDIPVMMSPQLYCQRRN